MLANLETANKERLKSWFEHYWQLNNQENQELLNLRAQFDLVCQKPQKINLNQQLITTIKERLNNLPPLQLLYFLLENNSIELLESSPDPEVSPLYLKKNFNKAYNELIPNLVKKLPKNNQILINLKPSLDHDEQQELIKNLQELYLEKYITTWESATDLSIKTAYPDLATAIQELTALSQPNNKFIEKLKEIQANSSPDQLPVKLTKEMSSRLNALHHLNLTELQNQLNLLVKYLTTIAKNPNPNQMAFTEIIKYLENKKTLHPLNKIKEFTNAQELWLQNYLQIIINNLWQLLRQGAHAHINHLWEQLVIPKYQAMIVNKYPIFNESKEEITLENFNSFFGPQGVINSFFNHYLKPLVNTEKINWSWKPIAGQKNYFSQAALEVFLRAALIQKMFYSSKTSSPKIDFTLALGAMALETQSFSLHIDGQKLAVNNGEEKKNHQFSWPGPEPGLATINFINNQGRYFTSSEFGPWAWFKVLDKSNVTATFNTKNIELIFDLNGNSLKATLTTNEPINPFTPEIINNFRCPKLLE